MKRSPRLLTVLLIALACGWLTGCQFDLDGSGGAQPPDATRTPFLPALPAPVEAGSTPQPLPPDMATGLPPESAAQPSQCRETAGRIEEYEETFTAGGEPFTFRVYLPPCFGSADGAPYPVLYMIHGQTYADDQWQRLGIGEAADALIASGGAPPFLIVMPREVDTFADIYRSSFSSDVIDGLVPWIDEHYPTCASRDCRAIGGLSRGGAWALHLGFQNWELFSAIGAHSTPPFNTTPREFPAWVQQIPAGSLPRVYMDIGRGDPYLSLASAFEAQLVEQRVPHEWYLFNGTHDEAYWSAHVKDYLAWYAYNWVQR